MLRTAGKVKIAKRVIEIFEHFDEHHPHITVTDIVRRYDRPQSSTSELLAALVEMGLLYKDPHARTYWPTPRLTAMGAGSHRNALRDGRLFAFMDELAQSTRQSVALFGIVGGQAQVFHWVPAPHRTKPDLKRGSSEPLSLNTVGHLLLASLKTGVHSMLHRLNAEAPQHQKFSPRELEQRIEQFRKQGHATGTSGFGQDGLVTAMLFPTQHDQRPLALGLFYEKNASIDTMALVGTLKRGIAACTAESLAPATAPFMIAV